jgi:hypothetical protein
MRTCLTRLALPALVLSVGCSSAEEPTVHEAPPPDACDLDLCPPADGAGFGVGLEARVEPGEEKVFCKFVQVPEGGDFSRIEHRYTNLSHHLVVYPTLWSDKSLLQQTGLSVDDVFECNTVADKKVAGVIYAAQGPQSATEFPPGVGYPLNAGSIVMLEFHTLNTGAEAQDVEVRMNFERAVGEVTHRAGTLFFYDYAIHIPPMAKATAQMRCRLPQAVTLLAGSSHMHARGVAQRSVLLDEAGEHLTDLFDTADWEEPEIETYDPVIEVAAGSQIDFRCDYDNPENRPVIEGPETTDEMCMAPFFYYAPKSDPDLGFGTRLCYEPGMGGPVHHGTQSCMETIACLGETMAVHRADALAAFEAGQKFMIPNEVPEVEQCITQSSPEASAAVHDLFAPVALGVGGCRLRECNWGRDENDNVVLTEDGLPTPGPCWWAVGSPECTACFEERCPDAYAACKGEPTRN